MKLHEIIDIVIDGDDTNAVRLDYIERYRNSLRTYLKNYYGEPIYILVTVITNNSAYGLLSPLSEIDQRIINWSQVDNLTQSEFRQLKEIILSNSTDL